MEQAVDIITLEEQAKRERELKLQLELDNLLYGCMTDISQTCGVLFPSIYTKPFSGLHKQIFDLINSGAKKIAIAAPRGIGKTSIARTVAMQHILFKLSNFIVYVGNNATNAEMQTENIKRDLLGNDLVQEYFPKIKQQSSVGMEESFSKTAWVAFDHTFILPRGAKQFIRGINFRNKRPQLIIIDDLEDKTEIKNPEVRRSIKDWFYSDLLKSVDQYDKNFKIIYIDTIKHPNALIVDLLESKDWASLKLSICDDNYKSNVPEYMSDEEIQQEMEHHRENGQLDVFFMEFMNEPVAKENASFKQEYFKYYSEHSDEFLAEAQGGEIESVVLVDPAKSTNTKTADSAIVGVGINVAKNKFYVRDIVSGKFHPDQLYEEIFTMCDSLNARVVGIEAQGLSEFIMYPFKNEIARRGKVLEVIQLKPKRGSREFQDRNDGKEARVAQLVPYYRQGQMFHNKANCTVLEEQLMQFPRPRRWDVMDALGYLPQILDMGLRYFMPPAMSDEYNIEDEFAELEAFSEPPLDDNWRVI